VVRPLRAERLLWEIINEAVTGRTAKGMPASECPKLSVCAIFSIELKRMPVTVVMAKKSYCRSSWYMSCARYIVTRALEARAVPDNLFKQWLSSPHKFVVGFTWPSQATWRL